MVSFLTLTSVIQSFAISLGVGSSTLAIANFFAATADGAIDKTERRMIGIVYVVLRIAMVAILLSTTLYVLLQYTVGSFVFTASFAAEIIVLSVLFLNAGLMTKHLISSRLGPAIQAGSWYTLAFLQAIKLNGMYVYGDILIPFLVGYVTWLFIAIILVNSAIKILSERRK